MPPKVLLGYVLLVVLWGSTWGAIKIGVSEVPPFVFAFARAILVAVLLTALGIVLRHPFPRGRQVLIATAIYGIVQTGSSWAVIFWSEQFVPSGLVSVFASAAPIWTALLAHFFHRDDRLSALKVAGLALGVAGTALLVSSPEGLEDQNAPLAAALLILMTVTWGVAAILASGLLKPLSPITVNAAGVWAGAIVLAPLALAQAGQPMRWTIESGLALSYLVIFGSCVGLLLNFWLYGRLRPTTVVLIQVLIPAEAILIGTVGLGELLTARLLVGAALIAAAVVLNAVVGGRGRAAPLPEAPLPITTST